MIRALLLTLTLGLTFAGPLALPTAQAAPAAEHRTVTLAVQNMTCSMCPITVRRALKNVPGVIEAKASLATKSATVTFDPTKTNVEALTKATADAGYPSSLKQ